jgi:hypothetical protein
MLHGARPQRGMKKTICPGRAAKGNWSSYLKIKLLTPHLIGDLMADLSQDR